jgi:hypothetical protein
MCKHQPSCPSADQADRDRACVVSAHPDQGWSLLCNGVVVFDDSGEILPDGRIIQPRETTNLKCHKTLVGAGAR